MFNKIIKAGVNTINKFRNQQPRTINAQYRVVTDTRTVGNGGGIGGDGIRAIALPPDVAQLLKSYYGNAFDLSNIPNMSPEQLGDFVSWLKQCEWMDQYLDILEKHIKSYVQRQVSFNEFVARVSKEGLSGAQKIDKAGLDIYLAAKGYDINSRKLGHKSDVEVRRLDHELSDYITLENYSLEAAFKAAALKLQKQKAQIDARPDQQAANEELRLQQQEEKQRIKQLLTYGSDTVGASSGATTTAQPKSGKTFWQGVSDFFRGK